jgi:hypothetical protein
LSTGASVAKKPAQAPPKTPRIKLFSPRCPRTFQQRRCVASANWSWHMASWIEIDRVRKDPKAFKLLANHLLADPDYARERSEFATDFLENISRSEKEELTTRQGEILLELRDEGRRCFEICDDLSIEILIEKFYYARLDLENDNDVAFIVALWTSGRKFITGKQLRRFLSIKEELEKLGDI